MRTSTGYFPSEVPPSFATNWVAGRSVIARCAPPPNGTMLLFRRQGADGTRVFTVASVLGPAKAQRCQTGPRLSPAASVRPSETAHKRKSEFARNGGPTEVALPKIHGQT